jgi:hypothetical protein
MALTERIQSKIDEVRRKAGRDVSRGSDAAKQRAQAAAAETKKRARQDLNRAEVAVSKAADDVDRQAVKKAAAAAARGAASAVDSRPSEPQSMMGNLRQASDARAPVDADLDPSGNPRDIESFASAEPAEPTGGDMGAVGEADDSLILGDTSGDEPGFFGVGDDSEMSFFGTEETSGNDLEFDDPFGAGGDN